MSLCMSPTVNSMTSCLARASPMHCLLPTPNGTRAGCFLYLRKCVEINLFLLSYYLTLPPVLSNKSLRFESLRLVEVSRVPHDEMEV